MINYNNKRFIPISNTANGEVDSTTVFNFTQEGNLVTATYKGGSIRYGQLIALITDDKGTLDMRYHHINDQHELMTGICTSIPEIFPDGRIRLNDSWQWTSGDKSSGTSVLEEIRSQDDL